MGVRRRVLALAASAVIGGTALVGGARPACAEDAAKATALAEAAVARARQGDRRVAIDLYEEAYAAAPRREYVRQIGILYDNLAHAGDSRDVRLAIVYLEKWLADEGATPERTAIEERLRRLRTWKASMRAEPQPPPPGPTPIHLFAYDHENQYEVAVAGQGCTTPCTVMAPPGITELKARGAGDILLQLAVPTRPSQIRLQHTDSTGYTAGAALLPTGVLVGASMWAIVFACPNEDGGGCQIANLVLWPVLGATMMITGIVLLARGKVSPAPDANRVEIVGKGGPRLDFSSFGLASRQGGVSPGITLSF